MCIPPFQSPSLTIKRANAQNIGTFAFLPNNAVLMEQANKTYPIIPTSKPIHSDTVILLYSAHVVYKT